MDTRFKIKMLSTAALVGASALVGAVAAQMPLTSAQDRFPAVAAQPSAVADAGAVPELSHPQVQEGIEGLRQFSLAFSAVADAVRPSVVSIEVEKTVQQGQSMFPPGSPFEQFFGPQNGRPVPVQGGGTGIIVTADGYILTNNHVVEGADTIRVHLADGRELAGHLRGADPKTDLAVIDIDARGLSPARLGDSDAVRVGEWVVAIGHPYGLEYTVTAGIVSAKGRSNLTNLVQYQDFIQTDASINPGNSGGPLVDLDGDVIGINTLIDGRGEGLGFSIPSNMASQVMGQLISTGKVVRPWLGVHIQDVAGPMASALGMEDDRGAFVADVEPGSPAEQAGLRPEDVIVSMDGAPVTSSNELIKMVLTKQIGQDVEVEVFRDGGYKTLRLTPAAMPAEEGEAQAAAEPGDATSNLGMELRPVTPHIAQELGLAGVEGVLVWSLDPTGPAARAGLKAGDVILEVDRQPVSDATALREALGEAPNAAVLFKVSRGGATTYVAVPVAHG